MKNFVVSLAGLSVLLSLAAYGTEVKTEEYYSKHLDEAEARLKECRELVQEGKLTKNDSKDCTNVKRALNSRREQ